MRKRNKLNLLGKILAAPTLVTMPFLGGCSYQDQSAAGALFTTMGAISKDPAGGARAMAIGNTLMKSAEIESRVEAGRQSRSNINVVVQNPPRQQRAVRTEPVRRRGYRNPISGGMTPYSVAFNYPLDENKDGVYTPNELKGASSTFDLSREKKISFASDFTNIDCKIPKFRLYDSSGRLIETKSFAQINEDDKINENFAKIPCWTYNADSLIKSGARGKCLVNWVADNRVVDAYYVNFTNSSK